MNGFSGNTCGWPSIFDMPVVPVFKRLRLIGGTRSGEMVSLKSTEKTFINYIPTASASCSDRGMYMVTGAVPRNRPVFQSDLNPANIPTVIQSYREEKVIFKTDTILYSETCLVRDGMDAREACTEIKRLGLLSA
jgi:hypothetical protein